MTMTLGKRDELAAYRAGAKHFREGKVLNEYWLGRREGVADAYRAGYRAVPHPADGRCGECRAVSQMGKLTRCEACDWLEAR